MKNFSKLALLALFITSGAFVTSCSDDSDDGGKGDGKDTVTFTEAKKMFETNGLSVINALDDMKNEEGMVAMASLSAVMPIFLPCCANRTIMWLPV